MGSANRVEIEDSKTFATVPLTRECLFAYCPVCRGYDPEKPAHVEAAYLTYGLPNPLHEFVPYGIQRDEEQWHGGTCHDILILLRMFPNGLYLADMINRFFRERDSTIRDAVGYLASAGLVYTLSVSSKGNKLVGLLPQGFASVTFHDLQYTEERAPDGGFVIDEDGNRQDLFLSMYPTFSPPSKFY